MITENKYILNDNLTRELLTYLNPKDLSSISQVNKKFSNIAEGFKTIWREECNAHFCSTYEHNR
jgi:hypothetical protein